MKFKNLNFVKFATYVVLVAGFGASAFASCGDSLSTMASAVAGQFRPMQQVPTSSLDKSNRTSMVGLWYIQFTIDGSVIQDAYQLWNAGGTEVHNPNVDPRTGNVCLGVWKHDGHGTYKLAHRVWNYDTNGNFLGTINLSEKVTLGTGGDSHCGSFTLDFYDPSGNFQMELAGTVTGQRISVE
ncbi:MAG: hypothetical protein WB562_10745 [Candidatus Sulfotelmatobacter sp.]